MVFRRSVLSGVQVHIQPFLERSEIRVHLGGRSDQINRYFPLPDSRFNIYSRIPQFLRTFQRLHLLPSSTFYTISDTLRMNSRETLRTSAFKFEPFTCHRKPFHFCWYHRYTQQQQEKEIQQVNSTGHSL